MVVVLLPGAVALAEAVVVVLLPGAVALAEAMQLLTGTMVLLLLPGSVVLMCCPSSPLNTFWSIGTPEVSLLMDAGLSRCERHPISNWPTGFHRRLPPHQSVKRVEPFSVIPYF